MEDREKRRTLSLTIRYQPTANNPLANVVDWLKSMSLRERRDKLEQLCLMTLLPNALKAKGKSKEEVESSYWEVHERLQQYLFSTRLALGISTSKSSTSYTERNIDVDSPEESTISEEQNQPKEAGFSDFNSVF